MYRFEDVCMIFKCKTCALLSSFKKSLNIYVALMTLSTNQDNYMYFQT